MLILDYVRVINFLTIIIIIVLSIIILCSPGPHGNVINNAWLLSWSYPGIHIIIQLPVDSFMLFCRAYLYSSPVLWYVNVQCVLCLINCTDNIHNECAAAVAERVHRR